MSQALEELISALTLTKINETTFVGQPIDLGLRQLYGGLIFAQATSAAVQYMDEHLPEMKRLHYATAIFINAGQVDYPIYYHIVPLRIGKSISALEVKAVQNGVQLISMQTSFHVNETGFEHQQTHLPVMKAPEILQSEYELAQQIAHLIPESVRLHWTTKPAFEIKPEVPLNPFYGTKDTAHHKAWFKVDGLIDSSLNFLPYALIAYHSDHNLLPSALKPHGKGFLERDMQVATLNHSIWFHNAISFETWLAYIIESPIAKGALALVRGEIFDTMGTLIATTQQEGLIRHHLKTH